MRCGINQHDESLPLAIIVFRSAENQDTALLDVVDASDRFGRRCRVSMIERHTCEEVKE